MSALRALPMLGLVCLCAGCATDRELLELGYDKSLHKHIGEPVDGVRVCVWPDFDFERYPKVRVDVIVVDEGIGLIGEPPIGFSIEVDDEMHWPEGVAFSFLSGHTPARGGVYGIEVILDPKRFRKAGDIPGEWGPGTHTCRIICTLKHPDGGWYKQVPSRPFVINISESV